MALLKHRKETFQNWVDLVINDNIDENTEYTLTRGNRIVGRAVGKTLIGGGDFLIGGSGETLEIPYSFFKKTNMSLTVFVTGYGYTTGKPVRYYIKNNTITGKIVSDHLTKLDISGITIEGGSIYQLAANLSSSDFDKEVQSNIASPAQANVTINSNNGGKVILETTETTAAHSQLRGYIFLSA